MAPEEYPRPLSMMQGIDDSFAAAIFIGYHGGEFGPDAVRGHILGITRVDAHTVRATLPDMLQVVRLTQVMSSLEQP